MRPCQSRSVFRRQAFDQHRHFRTNQRAVLLVEMRRWIAISFRLRFCMVRAIHLPSSAWLLLVSSSEYVNTPTRSNLAASKTHRVPQNQRQSRRGSRDEAGPNSNARNGYAEPFSSSLRRYRRARRASMRFRTTGAGVLQWHDRCIWARAACSASYPAALRHPVG